MKGRTSTRARITGSLTGSFTGSPAVQRAVDRARQAARDTAARLPRSESAGPPRAGDLQQVRMTDLLTDGRVARQTRRTARRLGLARTIDDTAAWAAYGALAALLRVVDDGSRRAVVIDSVGERSTFSRWAVQAGFSPLAYDVMRPEVVGTNVEPRSVDLAVRLHPHSTSGHGVDEDLTRASWAVRRGGLICITLRLGPADEGGVSVADLRSIIARAADRGLKLVGDLDIEDGRRAQEAQRQEDGSFGLALLTFRVQHDR
ncbi:hypothetical protein IEE94_05960 [Yimella sp. cx-573]|nr:hypothetical protein [Yimella sp. cx-573]